MKIAIEAQRIFRPNKHGMDFVALESIRELQKRDDGNEYYILVAPGEDRCLEEPFHRRSEMPQLSAVGANSLATCGEAPGGRPAPLYFEHSTTMVSRSACADAP